MLDSFRKHQGNLIFSFLLLAIVAVMALYGVNQMQSDDTSVNGTAAWVNGEPIRSREFANALEARVEAFSAQAGGQLDERLLAQFQIPQRVLEELVQYKLLSQQAYALGFRVPDAELASFIRSAPAFQRDGKFQLDLYRQLPERGLEEKRIRESLLVQRLQGYLAARVQVPADMLEREYELKDTQANLNFARIDFKALAPKGAPAPAEVQAFLAQASADALKAYYDSHLREFTTPSAVDLRQIRIGVPFQAPADKKAQAKAAIEKVAKEATPSNFESLATKHSDDEYAKKGGNAGWVNRGTLEPNLETAVGKLQPGQISSVVETPFGYYLLLAKAVRPETVQPLETVKNKIAEALLREKRATDFAQKRRTEWEAKLAAGQGLESELKAAGVEIKKTGAFSLGQGFVPQIGQNDEVLDAVFALSKAKPVAPKLVPSGTDYLYLRLESVTAPKPADAAANRASVLANTEASIETALLTKWIEKLKADASIRMVQKFEAPAPDFPM